MLSISLLEISKKNLSIFKSGSVLIEIQTRLELLVYLALGVIRSEIMCTSFYISAYDVPNILPLVL